MKSTRSRGGSTQSTSQSSISPRQHSSTYTKESLLLYRKYYTSTSAYNPVYIYSIAKRRSVSSIKSTSHISSNDANRLLQSNKQTSSPTEETVKSQCENKSKSKKNKSTPLQRIETIVGKSSDASNETFNIAIEDSYARFILNLPPQHLKNYIHLCFAIREAYWWYEDYWYESFAPLLPKLSMNNFGSIIFEKCPLLRMHLNPWKMNHFMLKWRRYCHTIPLKGAILLNNCLDKALLVQGWNGGSWMFPRGKIDEMEDDVACAVREMREELGVDLSKIINRNVYIEICIDDQPLKLYVIPGILETTPFGPRKRKEISRICWIPIHLLPGVSKAKENIIAQSKNSIFNRYHTTQQKTVKSRDNSVYIYDSFTNQQKIEELSSTLSFWNVTPFCESLFGWIDLYMKGSKLRDTSELAGENNDICHLNSKWLQHPDYTNDVYDFNSPPDGYNGLLEKKYTDQQCDNLLNLPNDDSIEKQTFLTGLLHCNPIQPKPQPLPPFVDHNYWYCIPQETSISTLRQLQHPANDYDSEIYAGTMNKNLHSQSGISESITKPQQLNHNLPHTSSGRSDNSHPNHMSPTIPAGNSIKTRSILQDLKSMGLDVGFAKNESTDRSSTEVMQNNTLDKRGPETFYEYTEEAKPPEYVESESKTQPLQERKKLKKKKKAAIKSKSIKSVDLHFSEIDDLSNLAQIALNAVNTCRERLGHSKVSPMDVIPILGLDTTPDRE